ncbi:hypothetical protein BLNAU_18714 [Blattamonas nauphoetae]|uniref:RING-CH-type domain-containing protein n=1 Tax=Blattamonas nauphoetae TaxID=2049346 RepID=A0ABQ9X445_9EUKA|nr:hypothetical protein BLNAU_18714 [Blattamonas nauphoetae]
MSIPWDMEYHHVCYICQIADDTQPTIRPCYCRGEIGWAHSDCLEEWVRSQVSSQRPTVECPFCHQPIPFSIKSKPMKEWKFSHLDLMDYFILLCTIAFFLLTFWASFVAFPNSFVQTIIYAQYTLEKPLILLQQVVLEVTAIAIFVATVRSLVGFYSREKMYNNDIVFQDIRLQGQGHSLFDGPPPPSQRRRRRSHHEDEEEQERQETAPLLVNQG